MTARSEPKILMPTGVRMPVESMSMRALMGMVQALTWPGICSASSISWTSSSQVIGPDVGPDFAQPLLHPLRRPARIPARVCGTLRHSFSGLSCTTVSNISIGAGSVAVSDRPALPWTVSTSGNCLRMRSWICIRRVASVMETVGRVVGM